MVERFSETLSAPTEAKVAPQDAPETYAGRILRNVREAGRNAYSLLDVSAGISLARGDIQAAETAIDHLNTRYDGMLSRQSAPDTISMALESDVLLDFRRDAQRVGYTDVDVMPSELRAETAKTAAQNRISELTDELQAHHPEWSAEQLNDAIEVRVRDMTTLLSMDAAQRDAYQAAMFEYLQRSDKLQLVRQELSELQTERGEHVAHIGQVALRGVVNFAGKLRDLPNVINGRMTVAGMSAAERAKKWYSEKSVESKKAVWFTAAGVATAGLASYIAMRFGSAVEFGGGPRHADYVLASDSTPLVHDIGETPIVHDIGPTPSVIDIGKPPVVIDIGTPEVVDIGGNVSGIHASKELFGSNDMIKNWPDTIKVSKWNADTKDGSLWGISEQVLRRSGVDNPTSGQIDQLVDALRPQAQPNGYLLKGQMLDLQPALKIVRRLS